MQEKLFCSSSYNDESTGTEVEKRIKTENYKIKKYKTVRKPVKILSILYKNFE